jgi:hypothetical protein
MSNEANTLTGPDQKDSRNARRKLLSSIVAGGGALGATKLLPSEWTTPLVESVLLPAHAQTTSAIGSPLGGFSSGGSVDLTSNSISRAADPMIADKNVDEALIDFLLPQAHALPIMMDACLAITATCNIQFDATFSENNFAVCTGGDITSTNSFPIDLPPITETFFITDTHTIEVMEALTPTLTLQRVKPNPLQPTIY